MSGRDQRRGGRRPYATPDTPRPEWPVVPPPEARVLPFRRRQGTPPVRRRRPLALLRHFLAATALVAAPVVVGWWVLTSPRFALATIEVSAGERVEEAWVRERLEPLRGTHLLRLPLAAVEARLEDHPWVAGIEATKEPPDRLRVLVDERVPAAVLLDGERPLWIDRSGRSIAPADAAEVSRGLLPTLVPALPADRPSAGPAGLARALDVVEELGRVRPDWMVPPVEVDVLSEEDFTVHSASLPFPLQLEAGAVELRVRRLGELLPEIEARWPELDSVDLRFAGRIVLRPAEA